MHKYLFIAAAFFSVSVFGSEKCDLLSVKGKKKDASACYKKEVKENMEIIDEYRESFEISNTLSPKQKSENIQKLDGYIKAIKESCKEDECRANETSEVIKVMNQIMINHNSKR